MNGGFVVVASLGVWRFVIQGDGGVGCSKTSVRCIPSLIGNPSSQEGCDGGNTRVLAIVYTVQVDALCVLFVFIEICGPHETRVEI